MDIPFKHKRKKQEQRFCISKEDCVYKSYFGKRCIANKRVIWRTCRHKEKPLEAHNVKG